MFSRASSSPSAIASGCSLARLNAFRFASVLSSLYPVTTVVLARFSLAERLSGSQMAGVTLALVGVVLISAG